ncbi:MAG: sigma 54-interacting transcriptional regulator [Deltaproteobacteria bacterium]|nr:sigma 54-interacting transcriptional regulator [Deltaproteobacteria bacterium]MBW2419758.1 sigma 54-interacting transcriptional regulator [Deltaproteobacteria bacterium]
MSGTATTSWSSVLVELTRLFSSRIEFDELLPVVLRHTKEAFGAESSSLLLLDESATELYIPLSSDVSPEFEERIREARFPADRGIAGEVLRTGESVHVPDASSDPRFYDGVDREVGSETRNMLCAPLRTERGTLGVIQVRNRGTGEFDADDLALLDALSDSIAIALENSQTYQSVQRSEAKLREQVGLLRRERTHAERFPGIIGDSPAMTRMFSLLESAADSEITVLVEGETGVGKEGVARAIHDHSARSEGPFIAINCGALQETILESELFGVRKGAFTGADADRAGLFEEADGGTLFLDEISETIGAMQVKLLRALEQSEIRRVGETVSRKIDIRVIAATNRSLEAAVREGRFREDLLYRINVFSIGVPPLRDRHEDIPALVTHLLERNSASMKKQVDGVEPAALELLMRHDWPGNVRQLDNELQRALAIVRSSERITADCLSDAVREAAQQAKPRVAKGTLKEAVRDFERDYIRAVLDQHEGSVTEAARALGVSRQGLHRRLKDLGLR